MGHARGVVALVMNADVIGLHHREAERLARREFPSLAEAKEVRARYTLDQILEIARKSFYRNEALEPDELEALMAHTRVRFADEDET